MKTTKTQNGLILTVAIFAVAMMVAPLQSADAFLQKSAFSENSGDGFKKFVKSSFGASSIDAGFRLFSSGVSLVDYVGDEDEDINVSAAGGDEGDKQDLLVTSVSAAGGADEGDKQDLLVTPKSTAKDDVTHPCKASSWGYWMPRVCIKDTALPIPRICGAFGRVC